MCICMRRLTVRRANLGKLHALREIVSGALGVEVVLEKAQAARRQPLSIPNAVLALEASVVVT